MASQDFFEDVKDITACPVCFDTFKTPRYIPCLHTFCQDCLHKHIVAAMSKKASLMGFHCPICREFVPNPAKFAEPEKWAEYFPKNPAVEFIIDNGGTAALKHCKPCQNDNEEEEANEMCRTCMEPLCKMCAKYHKRGTVTRHHDVIPLHEFEKLVHGGQQEMVCERHDSRPLEVFCYDHKTSCCVVCSIDEHGLCRNKGTIENEADLIDEGGEDDVLLSEIENIHRHLHEFKNRQEKNRTKIEDKADEITGETKKIKQQIIEKLDSLENDHLEKLAKAMKSARKAMDENMEIISDLLDFSNHCKNTMQNAKTTKHCLNYVHSFHQVRKQVKRLKSTKISLKKIDISVKFSDIYQQFIGLDQLASLSQREKSKHLSLRMNPQKKLN
ncbi:E3 ubiquitin-protein ligase TRIM56-like [Saccostrea cucullata]|uniref:E3 ubiquitin-protein ligase TRIM56-like n=1 Tax=Saccostrea cuccullata TaxID=36930 RepID=UPI002ED0B7CB